MTLGLIVQLGHTPGSSCTAMRRGRYKFTLIDVNGIHNVAVQFCECDSRITHRQQLMRVCWWPATARDPSTCATFNVLRLFENLNCLGKVSIELPLFALVGTTDERGWPESASGAFYYQFLPLSSLPPGYLFIPLLEPPACVHPHRTAVSDDAADETCRKGPLELRCWWNCARRASPTLSSVSPAGEKFGKWLGQD